MKIHSSYHSYATANAFSKLVLDYLYDSEKLKKYFNFEPCIDGIKASIESRRNYQTNRKLLSDIMRNTYKDVTCSDKISNNLRLLENENTFTICTAHQPNIFTGHLYFVYKIVHAIRLADELNATIPDHHFVPVYYMGSEDADLNELGQVHIKGKTFRWQTDQKGAVGRMKIDDAFMQLLDEIAAELSSDPYGKDTVALLKNVYKKGESIEQATFDLVNELFGKFGLLIFLPDNAVFKNECKEIVEKEILTSFSNRLLKETIAEFPSEYKVQASGRQINLFYLKDVIRERIEKESNGYAVANTAIHFTETEIKNEISKYPERFSPNVILRPLFQEKLLPNIVFIGGGGELAYWLELKRIFDDAAVPYPLLLLRNSFLMVDSASQDRISQLGVSLIDLFNDDAILSKAFLQKISTKRLTIAEEIESMEKLYGNISAVATSVDTTLEKHVHSLKTQSLKKLKLLEKKMLRAEKRNFTKEIQELLKLKNELFPNNLLQERVDNLFAFYAMYGADLIDELYNHSLTIEQKFGILKIEK